MLLDANVAQLVEQFTRNEQVAGSNPAISSKKSRQQQLARFFYSNRSDARFGISSSVYACISSKALVSLYIITAMPCIKTAASI